MGYFENEGEILDYFESKKFQQLIKEKGVVEFLVLLKKHQNYQLKNMHYEHYDSNPTLSMKNEE